MKTGLVLAVVALQMLSAAGATRLFEARLPPYGSSFARQDGNNGIHLAVSPVCGPLSGNVSDVNAGVHLSRIKTIVAFGVRLRKSANRVPCAVLTVIMFARTRTRTEGDRMEARYPRRLLLHLTRRLEGGRQTGRSGWRTSRMTLGRQSWTTRYVFPLAACFATLRSYLHE